MLFMLSSFVNVMLGVRVVEQPLGVMAANLNMF